MRPKRLLGNAVGVLAVAASLALASPGVRAVRADEAAAPESVGAQCSGEPAVSADARIQAVMGSLLREHQARAQAGEELPVMLNGRGYNYGPAPGIELDRVRAEAAAGDR